MAYPAQALAAVAALREYTLTDWETYLSVDDSARKQITIYKTGSESTYDPLLMPAHLLTSSRVKDAGMAKKFADWLTSRAGQEVIEQFCKNGQQVYTPAPTI
ncbi:putative extracellular tungstate binding protein [Metarhizium anisopliae]